jgi:hypothetical protein
MEGTGSEVSFKVSNNFYEGPCGIGTRIKNNNMPSGKLPWLLEDMETVETETHWE